MNKNYLSIIPAASIFVLISQAALAQEVAGVQDNADRMTSLEKVTSRVDRWSEQALKWKEKFKAGVNLPADSVERANKIKEQKDKICKNTQERVNERWAKYYDRRMSRVENMDKGVKGLENRIEFYKGKGLSTVNLESDLIALKALVGEYKTEYLKFLDALEGAKNLPCANYEGEFLPQLKLAKDQWAVVKQKADSIRDYYRNSVKKHLEELRAQLPAKKKIEGMEE